MKIKNYTVKALLIIACSLVLFSNLGAQSLWEQKTNFPPGIRFNGVSFNIGSKGYVGLGYDMIAYQDDLWEYDPDMETWTQKASFPGVARIGASAMSIGSKAYVGLGYDNNVMLNDFYEYDPALNTWSAKTPFPGAGRISNVCFEIGTKGYIGMGYNVVTSALFSDFYEYDAVANTWATKAGYPGGNRQSAFSFAIGSKGYVGGGYDDVLADDTQDFYEYSPATNTWTPRATFTPGINDGCVGFNLQGKGVVLTGFMNGAATNAFTEYDPILNTWTSLPPFAGPARFLALGFVIDNKLFLGLGVDDSFNPINDFWEYQSCRPVITATATSFNLCNTGTVAITASGANTYTWTGGITNGAAFTPTGTASYTVTGTPGGTCTSTGKAIVTIVVGSAPINQSPVFPIPSQICVSGTASINTGASEFDVNYYLRDNSNNAIVEGPVAGNGSSLAFNTGTITATTTYNVIAKKLSGALQFDGVNDYVSTNIDVDIDVMPVTTWEAWVYPTELGMTDWKMIMSAEDSGWDRFVAINNGSFQMGYSSGGWNAAPADLNQWQHIAVVYSGSDIKFYKNGVEYVFGATEGMHTSAGKFTIGANQMGTQNFEGKIDEVRVWNTIRTQAQIQANMNACLTGLETGLFAYYNFDNGAGSLIATDFAGGNNTGGLKNMNPATDWTTGVENCGCTLQMTQTPTVTVNSTIPTINAGNFNICSGNSVAIAPTGATSYTITGGNFTVTPLTTTSYSITGSNGACAATNTAVVTISVNTTPTVTVNSATICSGNSVAIVPAGADSYTITGGNYTVSPGTTNSYSVTGTAANGCAAVNPAVSTVSVNATPTLAVNSATICSGNSVAIVPTGADTYTITGGSFTVSPATDASYSVTGTSAAGCPASNTIVSTVSVNITPTLAVNSATICSGNSVAIVPTGAGTYTITGGNFMVSPNTTTSYSITGTAANNCVASNIAVATILVNTTPTLSVNSATICSGNSVAIVPTGADTYTITGGNYTVDPTANTSYTVTGTSLAGCVASNAVVSTVSVNTTPTLSVNSATICSGNSVAIAPSGANTYTINGGSFSVSPNTTTSYSITGTAANGCVASNIAVSTVSVNTTPTVTVNSATICSGNSVVIVPAGANTYTITGGNYTVSPNTTMSYSVVGTATNGCMSVDAVSNISVNITPTININNGTICPGNTFTLLPTGAGTYTYSGGTDVVSPASTTSYSVTGTGANGCPASNTAVATVAVVNSLTITVSGATTVCNGSATTLTAGGASTYSWNTGLVSNTISLSPTSNTTYTVLGTSGTCSNTAVVTLSVLTTPTVSVSDATTCSGNSVLLAPSGADTYTITGGNFAVSPVVNTTYSVTGTATNGCVSNIVVASVSVNARPTVSVNSPTICSGNTIAIVPSGATTYTITGGNFMVSPSSNASYSVTGTGTNGCVSAPAVSNVTVIASPTITANSATICAGASVAIVHSGASTYTITGNTFTVSPATTTSYSVTGTSTTGCASANTATATIVVNALPTITVNSYSTCAGFTETITPSGASTYTIQGGNFIVTPLVTTSYTISGTSAAGCPASNVATAVLTIQPIPTVTVNNPSVCLGNSVAIVPSGANLYVITGNNFTVSPTVNTTYTIYALGVNGCPANPVIVTVTVNAVPVVNINSGVICPGSSFTLLPSGADTYTVNGGAFTVSPAATTSYSVTGTSTAGCVSTSAAIATVSVVNSLTVSVSGSAVICEGSTTTLTASGATTYSWTNGSTTNTAALNPLTNTDYTVTGFSGTCSDTAIVSVFVNPLPVVTASVSEPFVCVGTTTSLTANGAATYSWSNGLYNETIVIAPTTAGTETYIVTGMNADGCVNTATATQTAAYCTAIRSIDGPSLLFGVYPNPTTGNFVVETSENISITVLNSIGQTVHSETTNGSKTTISIEHLANGIYFVKASANGNQQTVKIIKE